jgi:hypothetical protein
MSPRLQVWFLKISMDIIIYYLFPNQTFWELFDVEHQLQVEYQLANWWWLHLVMKLINYKSIEKCVCTSPISYLFLVLKPTFET